MNGVAGVGGGTGSDGAGVGGGNAGGGGGSGTGGRVVIPYLHNKEDRAEAGIHNGWPNVGNDSSDEYQSDFWSDEDGYLPGESGGPNKDPTSKKVPFLMPDAPPVKMINHIHFRPPSPNGTGGGGMGHGLMIR